MIQVQNISKRYGSLLALDQVSMEMEEGKVYGLVGENGAGKTTLFRCITGLESCVGQVSSHKTPLKNYTGFLPTTLYFFPFMTGAEYIRLLCDARKKSISDIYDQNIFDLPLDQYAETYSTGMQKKLALMAILLQGNDFFILDEPFNGVDIQSNMLIIEIIKKLKSLNKTVLISSHIFSTLSDTCDEIYHLHEGRIIRKVEKDQFKMLNEEMKDQMISNRLDRLKLS
jgi:ABC-2 type transport system ATP-binding protein